MADKPKKADPEEAHISESYPLFDAARKVLLAGIGAVSLAQDEVEDFIHRLVERGEIAEKDGKKLVQEMRAKRIRGTEKAEDELRKRVNRVLDRMNVASKTDIDELSEKITQLAKKLDDLNKT